MKIFILKSLLFITIIMLTLFGAGLLIKDHVTPNTIRSKRDQQFQAQNHPATTIFFGDSHIEYAINPAHITNAFNYAANSEPIVEIYYKIKYILSREEYRRNLSLVVLPYDLHTLSRIWLEKSHEADSRKTPSFLQFSKFTDQTELLQRVDNKLEILLQILQKTFLKHKFFKREIIMFVKSDIRPTNMIDGYCPAPNKDLLTPETVMRDAEAATARHFLKGNTISPVLVQYYLDCLELCRSAGVKVIIVTSPITREYYDLAQSRYQAPTQSDSVLSIILSKYDTNYLRYTDRYTQHLELFSDSDHLNDTGATVFSKQLSHDLDSILHKESLIN